MVNQFLYHNYDNNSTFFQLLLLRKADRFFINFIPYCQFFHMSVSSCYML
ncbi:hypothetical protein CLOHYLEM_06661 [[Clostridium] hylemonae DSM 15053]|uniref:Uncharacterized protein n=1 Tax=[Clostridium] hylemonae DSM 15053 TaxID=553973 RepID=C0C3J9_9FIRM|nr:hypothetical protein CLOHYLEM_06661 [[Clostridium] hylemonae DSM 15053]